MNKWNKVKNELDYIKKNLDIIGKNHRKIAKKQLKTIENLRNSWGYPSSLTNKGVDLEGVW